MTTLHRTGTTIARVRVKANGLDPDTVRSRLTQILNATDLQVDGLPATATLCVRTLAAPPLPFGSTQWRLFPPSAWEQTVKGELDRLARHAARPVRGDVPAGALAVLFADESELLVCLADDWCANELAAHWWWKGLLAGRDSAELVLRRWREAPQYVPAALEHLDRASRAAAFLAHLTDGDVVIIRQRLVETFALPDLRRVLDGVSGIIETPGGSTPADPKRSTDSPPGRAAAKSAWRGERNEARPNSAPPWASWTNEVGNQYLDAGRQMLLGIALGLQRAPAAVRHPQFARSVATWITDRTAASIPPAEGQPSRPSAPAISLLPTPGEAEGAGRAETRPPAITTGAGEAIDPALQQPATTDKTEGPVDRAVLDVAILGDHANSAHAPDARRPKADTPTPPASPAALPSREIEEARRHTQADSDAAVPQPARFGAPDEHTLAAPAASAPPPSGVGGPEPDAQQPVPIDTFALALLEARADTDFGGIFYLVNLGLFLGLYADFTTPLTPGLPLNLWDFVALVGRDLAGDELEADPLWMLLARLAGRSSGEPPGADFDPPGEWRIPVDWLRPFGQGQICREAVQHGRLRATHPAGFLVLDVPVEADEAMRDHTAELRAYAGVITVAEDPVPDVPLNDAGGLDRWLAWLLPYIRARLCRALGLDKPADLPSVLCKHRARVSVTASHVDIALSLADLPIAIRFAGLDRDPGWVPAAGRFIRYRYE